MVPAEFLLQGGILDPSNLSVVGMGSILGALVIFSMITMFVSRYKRCPANRVLVISGKVGGGNASPAPVEVLR